MAFVHLKNAGLTDNNKLDFTKTKTVRLASEQVGKDLYRQVHLVTFTEKSGKNIEVITRNDASNEECSMSGVEVYVVSNRLGGGNDAQPRVGADGPPASRLIDRCAGPRHNTTLERIWESNLAGRYLFS